ncbi:hypothetical protein ACOSQ2_006942 [Xanthoceras sorbifolium]
MLGGHISKVIELDLGASGNCVGPSKERFPRSGCQTSQGVSPNSTENLSKETGINENPISVDNRKTKFIEPSDRVTTPSTGKGKKKMVNKPSRDFSFHAGG